MKAYQFLLSSEECELLLVFEDQQTIEKTAKAVGRDASGISRGIL